MEVKDLIYKINHEPNVDRADAMLDMFNSVFGTSFELLAGRVVSYKGSVPHDVWITLD